ncbi:MAG: hypothetical protein HYT62_01365 [Candidatus Yanofskybacteria bacterium]|nr:hypothetical protein [Candidatus Yanofskybacteria bacterium]
MSIVARFVSTTEAKKAGYFSRRHENSNAHRDAQDAWRERHAIECVAERQAERAERSAAQQIALLDRRLGVGQGATKERARLTKAVAK